MRDRDRDCDGHAGHYLRLSCLEWLIRTVHQLVRWTEEMQMLPSAKDGNWLHVDPKNNHSWPQWAVSI